MLLFPLFGRKSPTSTLLLLLTLLYPFPALVCFHKRRIASTHLFLCSILILYNHHILVVIAEAGLLEHTSILSTCIFNHRYNKSSTLPSTRHVTMPSLRQIVGAVAVGLVAVATALPAQPKLSPQMRRAYDFGVLARKEMERRQDPATGLPDGLTDIDILELYVVI
jgi:hypothetical protein